jgi:hypothetical protein
MICSSLDIDKQIRDSKILDRKKTKPNYQFFYKDTYKCIQEILKPKNLELINIFSFETEESSTDIELAILKALLNCKFSYQFVYKVSNFFCK